MEIKALQDLIEYIDIGGPTLKRSAAKNFADVAVISNINDYIYAVYGLTNSSINLGDNLWQGSLDTLLNTQAYWI